MRKTIAISLVTLVIGAANAFAVGQARMTGKIVDVETKLPIPNAVVRYEAVEKKTVKSEEKVKKDGTYAVLVLDGTIRYKFTFSAPGYTPYEEVIKLDIGAPNVRNIELPKGGGKVEATTVPAGSDPAVDAYNEGAALANSGDYAGAVARFEAAVAANPDLTAGWMALAKTNLKLKKYSDAISAAKKALEIDDEDTDMWTVLHQAYSATGDKANAAAAEKKLPANAVTLFNQAARLINEGKDSEAEALLQRAVTIDAKMAPAHYELGMLYVRTGKNGEARQALQKYLELDPNGKDAATVKEMLNYIN